MAIHKNARLTSFGKNEKIKFIRKEESLSDK